jgi:hypothetical protein
MKTNHVYIRIYGALIGTFLCVLLGAGQTSGICQRGKENKSVLKYRIGQKYRPELEPSRLVLHISIEPKHFNREDMTALAERLNIDFPREKRLTAAICDEYKVAKDPGIIYAVLMRERSPALRGFYELDRVSGKEVISFSPERGKPNVDIVISSSKIP